MEGSLEEDLKEERNIFNYACRISYHILLLSDTGSSL